MRRQPLLTVVFLLLTSTGCPANSSTDETPPLEFRSVESVMARPESRAAEFYAELREHPLLQGYRATQTDYGIDFESVDSFEQPDGMHSARSTISIHGPDNIGETPIEAVMGRLIADIRHIVDYDSTYQPVYPADEGIGTTIVDIGGNRVGFIEARIDNAVITLALLIKGGSQYTFAYTQYDSAVEQRPHEVLETLVTLAVNDDRL